MKPSNGNNRLYEYVIESIRAMISSGDLKAGEKLPSERELAERFNVSRVPIREAFKILEYVGVLDSNRGDGTYLKNASAQNLLKRMDFSPVITADTIRDLLELRIVLESFAAYHAAQRRNEEDITRIKKLIHDMRAAKKTNDGSVESVQKLRNLSHGFHKAVVEAAHNVVLSSVYEYLYEMLDISRQFTIDNSGISYASIAAHEALFGRIIAKDAEGARQCMEEHMEDVRYNLDSKMQLDQMEDAVGAD